MSSTPNLNEYHTAEHALKYLSRADGIPHRTEGESVLLSFIPRSAGRILDLGSGDGRLLALLLIDRPDAEGIALDFSPTMLEAARNRFANNGRVQVFEHNLENPLFEEKLCDSWMRVSVDSDVNFGQREQGSEVPQD